MGCSEFFIKAVHVAVQAKNIQKKKQKNKDPWHHVSAYVPTVACDRSIKDLGYRSV